MHDAQPAVILRSPWGDEESGTPTSTVAQLTSHVILHGPAVHV